MTARKLTWLCFIVGMFMLWKTTHNWTAMFWAWIASLNFTFPNDNVQKEWEKLKVEWKELVKQAHKAKRAKEAYKKAKSK